MTNDSIGVDISKDSLDVHRLSDGATARFSNDPDGFRALAGWLSKTQFTRIVFEPTGPYHRAFEAALAARFPLVKSLPPRRRGSILCRPAGSRRHKEHGPKPIGWTRGF